MTFFIVLVDPFYCLDIVMIQGGVMLAYYNWYNPNEKLFSSLILLFSPSSVGAIVKGLANVCNCNERESFASLFPGTAQDMDKQRFYIFWKAPLEKMRLHGVK